MSNASDDKLFEVSMWSWMVGLFTVVIYGLIDMLIGLIEIKPTWAGDIISILVFIILIFVSFIVVGLIYNKHSTKQERE